MDRRRALIADLEGLLPADAGEASSLAEIRGLLDAPGDPFDRRRHDPGHVTASAFVLAPDGSRMLLILHRKLRRWLQPGGHVDPGDSSVWEAVRREVEEETGLAGVEIVGSGPFDVDVHEVTHDGHTHRHFDVRYLVRAAGEPVSGDGVDGIRWAGPEELAAMEESLRRPAAKAFGIADPR